MTFKDWIIPDLKDLDRLRKAVVNIPEEIATLEAEFGALKATSYDKDIVDGGGANSAEEKLITNIAKRRELETRLTYTQRFIAEQERFLSMLEPEERLVLELMYVNRRKNSIEQIKEELCIEQAQVYKIRNRALEHMGQLRFGKIDR